LAAYVQDLVAADMRRYLRGSAGKGSRPAETWTAVCLRFPVEPA
jgi:hypothetical protein